jgi:hypothetical protein
MYTLIRTLPVKRLAFEQAPSLGLALILAELFYKFHSFTLECIAFLATWFVLDAVVHWTISRFATPLFPPTPSDGSNSPLTSSAKSRTLPSVQGEVETRG